MTLQSANSSFNSTLGVIPNLPFDFGGGVVLPLHIHVVEQAPYEVLLGRPFDALTKSVIENYDNGRQMLTLKDPNTGQTVSLPTYAHSDSPSSTRDQKKVFHE